MKCVLRVKEPFSLAIDKISEILASRFAVSDKHECCVGNMQCIAWTVTKHRYFGLYSATESIAVFCMETCEGAAVVISGISIRFGINGKERSSKLIHLFIDYCLELFPGCEFMDKDSCIHGFKNNERRGI